MPKHIEDCLKKYIPRDELMEVKRILYGRSDDNEIPLSDLTNQISKDNGFEARGFKFSAQSEELRDPKIVRIAAVQHSIVLPTTDPIIDQRNALLPKIEKFVEAAAASYVNIVCFPETWNMPFGLTTQEKDPWTDFAEDAESGPTTEFLKGLAKKYNMVIVSPILERENANTIWNTAVVIANTGKYLGKHRKFHLPLHGRHNESTYYMEGNLGHPVFETEFGRIGINICYGRHHPQNWMMFGLNGAEIVFNPAATVADFTSSIWEIEARNAAIANSYFTMGICRVGVEHFATLKNGKLVEQSFGPYNGSSYVAAPDGTRSPGLSYDREGLLIAELDLNLCRQVKDHWGFRMTQRLAEYGRDFTKASEPDFKPQIIRS